MYYTIYKGLSSEVSYVALAKKTPFIDGRYRYEPPYVWFELGDTKEEALNKLKKLLPGNDWVEWEKTQ